MVSKKILKTFAVLIGTVMVFVGISSFISGLTPFALIVGGAILIIYGRELINKKKR